MHWQLSLSPLVPLVQDFSIPQLQRFHPHQDAEGHIQLYLEVLAVLENKEGLEVSERAKLAESTSHQRRRLSVRDLRGPGSQARGQSQKYKVLLEMLTDARAARMTMCATGQLSLPPKSSGGTPFPIDGFSLDTCKYT